MEKKLVKDYIENLKELNSASDKQVEYRPALLYCPKLDNLVFMLKSVSQKMKVSNIYLYIVEKNDKIMKEKFAKMSPEERIQFVLDNLHNFYVYPDVAIGNMSNYIDKLDWSDLLSNTINRLSILKVHQYFRRFGLAKELIKELRSDTLNNGYSTIVGKMSPLDNFDVNDEKYIKRTEEITKIKPELILKNSVNLHSLAQIYQHLGFIVAENYDKNRIITMSLGKHSVLDKDRYPEEFTDFNFHNTTDILVR